MLRSYAYYVVMQRIQEYPTSQLCFLGIHTCLKESMYTRKMQATSGVLVGTVRHEKAALHNHFVLNNNY